MIEPREFYRSGGAMKIMKTEHLPDALLPLLRMERSATLDALRDLGRDELVEFGCFDGRCLDIARRAGVVYTGVDVNPAAAERLRRRIRHCGEFARPAQAVLADACAPEQWRGSISGRRPLALAPFHLLGCVSDPMALLRDVAAIPGGAVLVSVFRDDAITAGVRRDYYRRCGITGLRERVGAHEAEMFTGDGGFRSETFTNGAVETLLEDAGLVVHRVTENRIGRCLLAWNDETQARG